MNSQISHTIRAWSGLRSLDYKVCKGMYSKLSINERKEMLKEATQYIDAVRSGRIDASKPALPKE